jgi:hypothetical protein
MSSIQIILAELDDAMERMAKVRAMAVIALGGPRRLGRRLKSSNLGLKTIHIPAGYESP